MKKALKELKEELKGWAIEIRFLKSSRKEDKRNGRCLWDIQNDIDRLSYKFRHHHIAYCEVRGRSREEIEQPKENFPNESYISQIKTKLLEKLNEENMLRSVA